MVGFGVGVGVGVGVGCSRLGSSAEEDVFNVCFGNVNMKYVYGDDLMHRWGNGGGTDGGFL